MVQNKHCAIPDVVSLCELATAQVWQLHRSNFSQVFFSLNIDLFLSFGVSYCIVFLVCCLHVIAVLTAKMN